MPHSKTRQTQLREWVEAGGVAERLVRRIRGRDDHPPRSARTAPALLFERERVRDPIAGEVSGFEIDPEHPLPRLVRERGDRAP